MSLIKNLIKETEIKPNKKSKSKEGSQDDSDEEKKLRPIIKSALDLQRLKLEKLMKNPDKLVMIPEHRKEKDFMQSVPTFVRNVMGSSAGAGSGEFHVYRHLRRKEYARQKMIQSKSHQEQLDDDYQQKLEDNRRIAEEKTAKKRAKRLKKKTRTKKARQKSFNNNSKDDEDQSESSSSDDEQNPGKSTDMNDDKGKLGIDENLAKNNEFQTIQLGEINETKCVNNGEENEKSVKNSGTDEDENKKSV